MNYKPSEISAVSKLLTALEFRGRMTEKDLLEMGEVEGIKWSTINRTLQKLRNPADEKNYCPFVRADKDEQGIIRTYYWDKGAKTLPLPEKKPFMAVQETQTSKVCCPSYEFFQTHAKSCHLHPDNLKVKLF